MIFMLIACKKHKQEVINSNDELSGLFGTWKVNSLFNEEEYWEFSALNKDTYFVMVQYANGIRVQSGIPCSLGSSTIVAGAVKYDFRLYSDSLELTQHFQSGSVITKFKKVNNQSVNHSNWVEPVKVLKKIQVPERFRTSYNVTSSSLDDGFGVSGDTIYFIKLSDGSNDFTITRYNASTNTYCDSITIAGGSVKENLSMYVRLPYVYYLLGRNIFRTQGFNTDLKTIAINNDRTGFLSVSEDLNFYYIWSYPSIFLGTEKGEMEGINNTTLGMDWAFYYSKNEFIMSYNNALYKIAYDGTPFKVLGSYQQIPGYQYIKAFGTDGKNIWVRAINTDEGKDDLLKIELD